MTNTITGIRTLHDGWSQLLVATIRRGDGETMTREIEDHGAAIGILPYDPDRGVAVLVRQFRAPAAHASGVADVLEAPAGLIEGEDPESCAIRELEEETGIRLRAVEPLGTVWSMPGISTERMHLFLAAFRDVDRVGAGGGLAAEHEDIAVEEVALTELAAMADDGRLDDMKTLCLVQTLRLRRPELFRAR